MENLERAHRYRDEAIHLRQLAGREEDARRRESLLAAAGSYDRLYSKWLDLAMPPPQSDQ